jgi:hypothetical protein
MPRGSTCNCRFLCDRIRKSTFYVGSNPIGYVRVGHTDNTDNLKRRNEFVGQVSSVVCYFNKLNASMKYKLFKEYCMDMYGCELWLSTNDQINDLRASRRKGQHMPDATHCYLLLQPRTKVYCRLYA